MAIDPIMLALMRKGGGGGSGVQADYAQNDPNAADYIKNRPGGYYDSWEITWDGEIGDRLVVDIDDATRLVKVSDRVFTKEELVGSEMTGRGNLYPEEIQTIYIDADLVLYRDGIYGVKADAAEEVLISIFSVANVDNTPFTQPGTYFRAARGENTSPSTRAGGMRNFYPLSLSRKSYAVQFDRKYIEGLDIAVQYLFYDSDIGALFGAEPDGEVPEGDPLGANDVPPAFVTNIAGRNCLCGKRRSPSGDNWGFAGFFISPMDGVGCISSKLIRIDETTGLSCSISAIKGQVLKSSTIGSTKNFEITVDDTGTLKATEVT